MTTTYSLPAGDIIINLRRDYICPYRSKKCFEPYFAKKNIYDISMDQLGFTVKFVQNLSNLSKISNSIVVKAVIPNSNRKYFEGTLYACSWSQSI